jgi:hypothetical protein
MDYYDFRLAAFGGLSKIRRLPFTLAPPKRPSCGILTAFAGHVASGIIFD